ncbi:MAG: bifunctional histidinol-phosphatase/imidazoleglycerol-phosphate dehydratase HisB [Rikenellaceae bacterium]
MKKVLIIDRDGTIIVEPPIDYQVDSLEKLEFRAGAITALSRIADLDFELVMASNQDGLGTDSFPEETFHPAQNKMLQTLRSEGVEFDDILIDPSFPEENSPNRKPGIGMFGKYLGGEYDLASSYVIGDRLTDVQLAKNLGAKAIYLSNRAKGVEELSQAGLEDVCLLVSEDWNEIYTHLRLLERRVRVSRNTAETKIDLTLDLDGGLVSKIDTGLKFFDHMLDQIVHHAGVSLQIDVDGDLEVDEHHTMEDLAIVLGEAFYMALGSKRGIGRYGFALPMDECRAMALIDFGGRIDFDWQVEFAREMIGDTPTEMFSHFFKSFAAAAHCNLHLSAVGENEHHKIEGVFKAFARAIRAAISRQGFGFELPSSKGIL